MEEQPTTCNARTTSFGRLVEAHALLWGLLNDDMERAVGLPLQWYGVLLRLSRSANGLWAMNELTAATAFTSGGVTRLVDRMEQEGYVERLPCPKDRRVHYVGLTRKGRDTRERATEVHLQGIMERVTTVLELSEVAALDAILTKLLTAQGRCP